MQRQRSQSTCSSSSAFPATPYTRKRTHLKPSQVAVLQESFVTNALPDAAMRSSLARELEVSERTIQIWFQNRRAKARKSEAYSIGQDMSSLVPNVRTGWIEPPTLNNNKITTLSPSPPYQATFHSLITPEFQNLNPRFDQSLEHQHRLRSYSSMPETHPSSFHDNILPTRAMSEGTDRQMIQIPIPANALRIGSWARFMSLTPQNEWDLVCYCHPVERVFVWQVEDNGHKFRIELDMDQIHQVRLTQINLNPAASTTNMMGQLEVDVNPQVRFGMRQGDQQDWVRCGDFSENKQASVETMHVLQGNYEALKHALLDITNLVPDFSPKLVLPPPSLDVSSCRTNLDDVSVSPCSTPEPIHSASTTATTSTAANGMMMMMMNDQHYINNNNNNNNKKDLMGLGMPVSSTMMPPPPSIPTSSFGAANQWFMDAKLYHPPPPPPPFDQMQQYYMQLCQQQQQQQQQQQNQSSLFM